MRDLREFAFGKHSQVLALSQKPSKRIVRIKNGLSFEMVKYKFDKNPSKSLIKSFLKVFEILKNFLQKSF